MSREIGTFFLFLVFIKPNPTPTPLKKVFCLILLLCFSVANSQNKSFIYTPNNIDSIQNYINKITTNKIGSFDIKNQKKIKEILLERKETFFKSIKDSSFIFDKNINNYLQTVLAEIYRSNPQIDNKDFYFLISKSLIPNAACYGNGIFTINLGLFNLAENNDEIAFIICHELSHYILNHNDKSLLKHIQTFNSKDVKKKLSAASNLKYGRRAAVTSLLSDLKYNFMKHSRNDEIQADSLGIVLFSKTKYSQQAAVTALKKLDFDEGMVFNNQTNLKQNFNFKDYPFKEVWTEKEDKLFDITQSANDFALDKDSLKTHPDIPLRIETILHNNKLSSTSPSKELLDLVKKKVAENSFRIYYDSNRYDYALYQILSLHENQDIDDLTYTKAISTLFKKIFLLKQNHVFGKYVEPANTFSEEKYVNEIRLFLNNLELKNVRKIGYAFCAENELKAKDDVLFQDNFSFFKNLNQN
ncbi:M48 family metallopeptidase [Flavobacterium granuli]|uniref:Zn-dependent protease with chaperone function n=1 Tax=Flavobacterium granuli TaxID=280093 RepID=A0ABU1S7T8_9FLAO|nr:M48 family metallopeptidase [Flavobacterium granuli]MDR6846304.1 Zn-dependent protease with chaperone function [Flavobacterium granuli]